ncbi:hypothetical protein K3495_g7393 [Podosphaera aphanis]|nr:hypothetical protein K3495_g7393 [Podosphaera aphanis]
MSVTPDIAISAFRKSGLVPVDSSYALKKLKLYREDIGEDNVAGFLDEDQEVYLPSTPQTQRHIFHNWNRWPTPTDMPSRKDGYDYIQRRLDLAMDGGELITPSVRRVTQKLESSGQRAMLKRGLASQRIHDLNLTNQTREKAKDGKKVVQKFSVVYGGHARRQIEDDKMEGSAVVNMRDSKLARPWKAKYKRVMKELKQILDVKNTVTSN